MEKRKRINIALELNNFLYDLGDKKYFMGSDGIVNGKQGFQFDIKVGDNKYQVFIINN